MLKILIVDDNSDKIRDCINTLKDVSESLTSIYYVLSAEEARKLLSETAYDLLIVDIKLPNSLVSTKISDSGVDILNAINEDDDLIRPTHIIGITSHDDSKERFSSMFEEEGWLLLSYKKEVEYWKTILTNKLLYIINWKQDINKVQNNEYRYDFAFLTAVDIEYKAMLDSEVDWQDINLDHDDTLYKEGVLQTRLGPKKVVLTKQSQMGMTSASVATMKLIENFKPKYIFMVGITGGVKGSVNLGDILVAKESWDYGSGKMKKDINTGKRIFEPDPRSISIDSKLEKVFSKDYSNVLFELRKPWKDLFVSDVNLHLGQIGTGAAVIQDQGILDEFVQPHKRKIIGVDMEIYGVYYAANHAVRPRPQFAAIKGVCDFADQSKNDDYQKYAAYMAANFILEVLKKHI